MDVKLINYTKDAMALLIYTKNTRLQGGVTLADIVNWPYQRKLDELQYIFKTIKSSWEFVDYTFEIKDVSRNFTHQFVRTRQGSYAQQSQRSVNISDQTWDQHPEIAYYDAAIESAMDTYQEMVERGVPLGVARGVVPSAVHTSIIAKFNLRMLSQMSETRMCLRTQGEYRAVFKAMRDSVIEIHPWVAPVIQAYCAQYGTCCFPNYTQCPVQHLTMLPAKSVLERISDEILDHDSFEANPVAAHGRTM